jgi:uncharacterized membrane protein
MDEGVHPMKKKLSSRRVTGVSPLSDGHRKIKPPRSGGIQLKGQIQVDRPPAEAYRYWRNFENLPSFMRHLRSVEIEDDRHSHWVVMAPADTTMEWDAEIIEDKPDERISWRSTENAQVDNAGSVRFEPANGGQTTDVTVTLTYNPPAGILGVMFSEIFGEDPAQSIADDLERFKAEVEQQAA